MNLIRNNSETDSKGLFWSNDDGWVGIEDADIFQDQSLNLPIDGEWVEGAALIFELHRAASRSLACFREMYDRMEAGADAAAIMEDSNLWPLTWLRDSLGGLTVEYED
tara:strand:+ start:166233 stop:166556 length:324 start_codon:yes stop_codon:yes gene_type:complete